MCKLKLNLLILLLYFYSCTIRLYERTVGRGRVVQLTEEAVKDLQDIDFDNEVSSVKISGSCRWIFYTNNNFEGESTILEPGPYSSLDQKDDTFSSLRPLPREGTTAAVVFKGLNFCGSMMVLTKTYNQLDGTDFNDKTSSIIVIDGVWAVSQHAWNGFEGYTEELGRGDYAEVSEQLRRKISLIRLIEE